MTRLHGTKDFWLAGLHAEAEAFAAAAAEAPPDAPVPSCPEWTTTDLIHHLGATYEWTTGLLTGGGRPEPYRHPQGAPVGAAAVDWWRERYAALMATLMQP